MARRGGKMEYRWNDGLGVLEAKIDGSWVRWDRDAMERLMAELSEVRALLKAVFPELRYLSESLREDREDE
jgi:hypothetical protein